MTKAIVDTYEFADAYNDVAEFPSLLSIAETFGITVSQVKLKAASIRSHVARGANAPELIIREIETEQPPVIKSKKSKKESKPVTRKNPMSESAHKFMEKWGPEDCIAELRRVAELDEEKIVTRNYFRNNSKISESTWNRYFGTFEEFKRQANITLSRQQQALEKQIAKHASVDHYRKMNEERLDWGDRYIRDKGNRFKTIMVCSDLHDIEIDLFYLRVLIDTAQRAQPDVIALVGDIFDLPEFGKYGVDPREWDVVGRIKWAHENILGPLRKACPNAQIDFIEGNHEARLLRQLADATPALRAVLSDLHGMTVGSLLGLEKYEINYIAKADLGSFTKREFERELQNNYKVYFDTVMCHHFPYARRMGLPGVNGHHHQHVVWSQFSPIFGAYEWHQLGSGHKRSASYCEGEKWHNGFALINVDTQTKATNFDYIPVTDFAVSGGKWYYRNKKETY